MPLRSLTIGLPGLSATFGKCVILQLTAKAPKGRVYRCLYWETRRVNTFLTARGSFAPYSSRHRYPSSREISLFRAPMQGPQPGRAARTA